MIKKDLLSLLPGAFLHIKRTVFWQWLSLLSQVIAMISLAYCLDAVLEGAFNSSILIRTLIVFLLALLFRFLFEKLASKSSYRAGREVKWTLRDKIYSKLLRLGESYPEHIATSEVLQISTEGVEQLEIYFSRYLPQLFYSLLAPITLFAILSFFNFKSALVLLLCVPLIPISIVAVQRFAKKLLHKYWGIYVELGDHFLENLQGLTTLKIYQADEAYSLKMDEDANRFRQITMKVLTMQLNSISVMDMVAYGGAALGMIVTLREFSLGHLPFGQALAIILLASEFFIPLRLLGSFFHIAMNGMAASDEIFALLRIEEKEDGKEPLDKDKMDIVFDHVSFSYDDKRTILKDISFSLKQGNFVSLVGPSGCGKSTLTNILTGKLSRYQGSIFLGEKKLPSIKKSDLMKEICLVQHDSTLFKGSVRDNLLLANPNASEEEMIRVLEEVHLFSFLKTQEGLDTKLMEGALNFSGGQRQRLALARALLHDSAIYIFDEATSNVDVESEEMIMEVIHRLAKEKTVLLISHRLSNVVDSDCIYYMENGNILEYGNHESLMSNGKGYSLLFEEQARLEAYGKAV